MSSNGWTLERRAKQAEQIKQWMPWKQSTGPKSVAGKERVATNAWRCGLGQQKRDLSKTVNAECRQTRELVASW